MKKLKICLVSILLICFVVSVAWAGKTWKEMNLQDCTIVGVLNTANGAVFTSDIVSTTSTVTLRTNQTGKIFDNYGSTYPFRITLPAWALGLIYTVTISTSESTYIVPGSTARILRLTNTTGDSIASTTVGSSIVLVATGVSTWVPRELGSWSDTD